MTVIERSHWLVRRVLLSHRVDGPASHEADWAAAALSRLQNAHGAWEGEVIWCPVITAQVVILHAIAGRRPTIERRRRLLRQFAVTSRPDGGWGLHPEFRLLPFRDHIGLCCHKVVGRAGEQLYAREGPRVLGSRTGRYF